MHTNIVDPLIRSLIDYPSSATRGLECGSGSIFKFNLDPDPAVHFKYGSVSIELQNVYKISLLIYVRAHEDSVHEHEIWVICCIFPYSIIVDTVLPVADMWSVSRNPTLTRRTEPTLPTEKQPKQDG